MTKLCIFSSMCKLYSLHHLDDKKSEGSNHIKKLNKCSQKRAFQKKLDHYSYFLSKRLVNICIQTEAHDLDESKIKFTYINIVSPFCQCLINKAATLFFFFLKCCTKDNNIRGKRSKKSLYKSIENNKKIETRLFETTLYLLLMSNVYSTKTFIKATIQYCKRNI